MMVSNQEEINRNFLTKVIAIGAIALALYLVMLFVTIPRVLTYSNGMEIPDLKTFGYGSNYIYDFLTQIGPIGRTNYIFQIFVDMFYPLMLSLTFYMIINQYLLKKGLSECLASELKYLPWTVMLLDYSENLSIFIAIMSFPVRVPVVEYLAPVFTLLKGFSTTILFTSLIFILIYELILSIKKKSVLNSF